MDPRNFAFNQSIMLNHVTYATTRWAARASVSPWQKSVSTLINTLEGLTCSKRARWREPWVIAYGDASRRGWARIRASHRDARSVPPARCFDTYALRCETSGLAGKD